MSKIIWFQKYAPICVFAFSHFLIHIPNHMPFLQSVTWKILIPSPFFQFEILEILITSSLLNQNQSIRGIIIQEFFKIYHHIILFIPGHRVGTRQSKLKWSTLLCQPLRQCQFHVQTILEKTRQGSGSTRTPAGSRTGGRWRGPRRGTSQWGCRWGRRRSFNISKWFTSQTASVLRINGSNCWCCCINLN